MRPGAATRVVVGRVGIGSGLRVGETEGEAEVRVYGVCELTLVGESLEASIASVSHTAGALNGFGASERDGDRLSPHRMMDHKDMSLTQADSI